MRNPMRTTATTLAVIAALLIGAAPALAGPPWISIEFPTNPHHPSTRGAAFLVHVYHHTTSIESKVIARAEGRIDGQRKSVVLTVEPTTLPGVYAVSGLPDDDGDWVAVVSMSDGSAAASAVVALGPDREVVGVNVPADRTPDGWLVPRAVTSTDIERGLRTAAAVSAATRHLGDAPAGPAGAALPLLFLVPAGLAVVAGARRPRRS